MNPTAETRPARMQSLGRGLAVLDQLVHAPGPSTATEIAHRCGMHQTTASRILADLVEAGYARKISYREFAPDFGLLTLGLEATRHFSVLNRPRLAMERAAAICAGLSVSLCMLWRDQLLYFVQARHGQETQLFQGQDYPLQLSAPGLLFMLELPKPRAVAHLTASRRRHGWSQPTSRIAATETALLAEARRSYRHDTLVLTDWAGQGHVTAAIRLADREGHPLALAMAGAGDVLSAESVRLRLHEIRRLVEDALPPAGPARGGRRRRGGGAAPE